MYDLLHDYGRWVQFSVFECQIGEKDYRALRRRLKPLIHEAEGDNIRFYQLCGACCQKIEQLGLPVSETKPPMIL